MPSRPQAPRSPVTTQADQVGLARHGDSPRFGVRGSYVVVLVPQLVSQAARRGDRLDGKAVFEAAGSLPEGYAAPEGNRHDHQVHEVDQVGLEELTHGRGSSADADIATTCSLLG